MSTLAGGGGVPDGGMPIAGTVTVAQAASPLPVSTQPEMPPWNIRVPVGTATGWTGLNKFGVNPSIDTNTDPEDVWQVGGVWVRPTAASIHQIASSTANDLGGGTPGTGLRTLTIEGIDENWAAVTETVTMNGTTNVPTTLTYWRIHRMYGTTWGSQHTNDGDITATADSGGTVTASILAGWSQTQMAIYTVPTGKTLYLCSYYGTLLRVTGGGAGSAQFQLISVLGADLATWGERVRHSIGAVATGSNQVTHTFDPAVAIDGPADVLVRVLFVSASGSYCSAGFCGYITDTP